MSENNFKELLEKAVEAKKTDTTGIANAIIIASAVGLVLSAFKKPEPQVTPVATT